MKVSSRQARFLQKAIQRWLDEGTLTADEAEKLNKSYTVYPLDWKKIARWSFWVAMASGLISFGAVVADDYVIQLIADIFSKSNIELSIAMLLLAGLFYYLGLRGRQLNPVRDFSNEALIFIGALFTAGAVFYFGRSVSKGSYHYSLLFLLAAVLYFIKGLWFPSRMLWVFALISLASWFGTETGFQSGWSNYWLGLNYAARYTLFSAALVLVCISFRFIPRLQFLYDISIKTSLLYLFTATWMLSIFGNYGDMDAWIKVKQIELAPWAVLFGVLAIGLIIVGVKLNDNVIRGYGITFLFINVYTRYFEYCFNNMHKAFFFFILALSFWLVGSQAEKIWNVGSGKKLAETAGADEILDDEE